MPIPIGPLQDDLEPPAPDPIIVTFNPDVLAILLRLTVALEVLAKEQRIAPPAQPTIGPFLGGE